LNRATLLYCSSAYLLFGALLVLLGSSQAELAEALALDLAHSGLLASSLALGLGIGVVLAGPLFDRCPRRPVFVAAMLLAGAPLIAIGPGLGYTGWLLCIGLAGVGAGMYETLVNGVVTEGYAAGSLRVLALLHALVTLGAVSTPLLMGWLAAHQQWMAGFRGAGAAHLLLAAAALVTPLPRRPARSEPRAGPTPALLSSAFLPYAIALFAYVGFEESLTLFASAYAVGGLSLAAERGRTAISAFWLGLLAGRLLLAALHGLDPVRTLAISGALGAGVLGGAIALGIGAIEVPYFGAGACLGAVFPLVISLAASRFPQARGSAAGLAAGAGSLGGFAVPWLTGALGDAQGVTLAIASLAIWPAVIALSAAALRRAT
jgi:fucose permease